MIFFQIPSPDLSTLALGGATLRLLESYGFSADENYLLVRATYTDDADTSYGLNYGFFIYDVQDRAYVSNLNAQIVGVDNARDVDVVSAQIVGNSSNLTTIALVQTKGSETMRLTSMVNGQVVSSDLIAELTDIENVGIESFQLARSGRFLAVQTSNAQLSLDNQPDTNDSSDIYLFDLSTGVVTRVSYVGGSEVNEPTYLKSIFVEGNQVSIGFVTDAAFVSPSRVDTNSTNYNADAGFRSDAYVWSSSFNTDGLIGNGRFDLQSIATDGTASGYVSSDDTLQITTAGVFFTSSSETLINADFNGEKDVYFTDTGAVVSRLNPPFVAELASGAIFLGANKNGSRAAFLTDSDEISGATGAQQLILLDTNTGDASVVSEDKGVLANDWVISGSVSASGYSVAFTSAANNLTQEPLAAASGSLFVKIDKVPIVGQVYHWRTHALLGDTKVEIVDGADSTAVANIDTDAFGAYSLTNLTSGESRLTATKTLVESDTNRVVTSADALAALKIAVGLNPNTNQEQPVSPYQLIAADVNKDGRVSSADALATLKIAVGLVDAVPQEWLFVPESAAYWDESDGVFTLSRSSVEWDPEGLLLDSPDIGEVNFVALLLGDVNGSWDSPDSAVLLEEAYFIALDDAGYGPLTQWGEFPGI